MPLRQPSSTSISADSRWLRRRRAPSACTYPQFPDTPPHATPGRFAWRPSLNTPSERWPWRLSLRSGLLLRVELDRRRVDAVAQACWLRPVVEDVPQVPATARARDLGPDHEMRVVRRLLDRRALGRGVKARPAAVGVELGLGLEQPRAAAGAQVNARRLGVPVLAREGPFGALLTQHVVLGRGQVSLPLGFALLNFALLHRL